MVQAADNGRTDEEQPERRVRVRHLATILVWMIVLALVLWFFSGFKMMLLGLLAAAAVASALWPIMTRMHRSRKVAALTVGIGFLAVLAAVIAVVVVLLVPPVKKELEQLPETRDKLDAGLRQLSAQFELRPPLDTATLLSQVGKWFGQGGAVAMTMGQTVVSALVALALVLIGAIYFLAEPRDHLIGPVLPALPPRRQRQVVAALDELGPKLRWWLIGVLSSMSIVGVVSAIGYLIAGIKFAIPLALLAGIGELVPTVGPLLAGVVATLVGLTQGPSQTAGAVITWAVVQTVESYVLLPLIMRQAVHMPAVVTLFSVILWGEVFGAAGLFMAIPINLLLWTFFKHLVINDEKGGPEGSGPPRPARLPGVNIARESAAAEAHPT